VDENVDDPCSRKKRYNYQTGRDGGQQKFPSPDPCNLKKRSEQSGRDGGQQKFPSPEDKRSGIVSDIDPTSLQTGLDISLTKKAADINPYNRMGKLQKRLNPHHRMAPDFGKRSAKRLHEPELDFTELFQTLEEGTNDDAIIVEGKRDNSNVFRPLPKDPEEEGKIVEVKRMGWNPHHTKPYQTDFDKRSAQAEWQTNTNPLFRPLNENTEEGTNEDAIIAVGNKRSTLDQVYQDYKGLTWLTDKATNGDAIVQLGNGGAIVPLGNEKRSAQAEWQTNTNPLFRPLNENTEEGTNEDAIVSVKRSAQAEWQTNTNPLFRPLNENTEEGTNGDAIVSVKRSAQGMNPFNRMAEVNPFNRMATPPSKRNNDCASNSPDVEYDESLLSECCNIWFPTTPDRSGRVKDIVVFRACSNYLL